MATSLTARHPSLAATDTTTRSSLTRALLGCGVIAGPFYLALGLAQALTRPGFDLSRHELSQLALGDWGWLQITNFYISGLLVVASAIGFQRVMRSGRGSTWVPRLIGLYGLGLIGAGVFTADAGLGFPSGTPADATTVSTHGVLHLACAAVGFLALIVASIAYGRRCVSAGQSGWGAYSIASGMVFLMAFFVGARLAGSVATHSLATLMLWVDVLVGWLWLTTTSMRLRSAD